MSVLDCKALKAVILDEIKEEIKTLPITPNLTIIQVIGDDASSVYVRNKAKLAKDLGIDCEIVMLPRETSQNELNDTIEHYSKDESVNGLILQLPLPNHLDANEALSFLAHEKDVDGLTTTQQGYLMTGELDKALVPATPLGVVRLLKESYGSLSGLDITVVGRSRLFGLPLARLLIEENATVTVCHSKSEDIDLITQQADIVVVAVGRPQMFNDTYFSLNTKAVIDVGINLVDGKLVGDVDTASLLPHMDYTVTPGGTGQLTVPLLLKNVVKATKQQRGGY